MIHLTPAAATRINTQLAQRGKGVGLRLGVKKSGCSGWAYVLDYADALEAGDQMFELQGATVVIKTDQLDKLDGLTLDFKRDGLNVAFKFINPNVKAECGCGESFAV